jgi:hypothetical protein
MVVPQKQLKVRKRPAYLNGGAAPPETPRAFG